MRNFSISILLSFLFILSGCIPDDKFGLSPYKEIKTFEIAGQAAPTVIDREALTVTIPFNEGEDVSAKTPSNIVISNLATIDPPATEARDLTDPVIYTVTAEDGSQAQWEVIASVAEAQPQLPNSNFDLWYDAGGYMQPGENAESTIWDTANAAITIAAAANTTPEDLGNGDLAVKMVSVKAPLLVRMAAATLYTGSFTDGFPDPVDPRSNIDFGTLFSGQPDAFRIDYRYLPGSEYLDARGNPLPGGDQADIYVLLENRDGNQVQRVATGWYRSDAEVTEWTTLEVPLTYGELPSSDPTFEYANIRAGESWAPAGTRPTHITVVFSSSALGDDFTGAIGSELWVNNFELIY